MTTGLKKRFWALPSWVLWRCPESIRPIHEAVDLGMDFLDTADMYGAGLREEITFDAFTARREQRCRLVVESSIEIGRLEQQQAPPQAQTAVVKRVLAKLTEPV